jgi:hypothetical protein
MSLPIGTKRIIPITANRLRIGEAASNFSYQIKLNLTNESKFKSLFNSANNIVVYDPLVDMQRPATILITPDKNSVLVYFDGPTQQSENRQFYVCAGPTINRVNSSQAFTNSGITNWWGFDEQAGSTTVADYAGGVTGELSVPSILTNGYFGGCVEYFNNSVGFVKVNNGELIGVGALSIDMMLLIKAHKTYNSVVTNGSFKFIINSSGQSLIASNGSTYGTFNTNLQANAWYHVVVQRDANGLVSLFLNGIQIGAPTNCGSPTAYSTYLRIGAFSDNSFPMNGKIDQLSIINSTVQSTGTIQTRSAMLLQSDFWTVGHSFDAGFSSNIFPTSPRGYGYAKRY